MSKDIVNRKIVSIREMTKKEASNESWDLSHESCRVLELDNGVKLYASRDYEGNGPGALFYVTKKGDPFAI